MYLLYNINGNEPLIYHINGELPKHCEEFIYAMADINSSLNCPKDLTIIFCENDFNNIVNSENTQKYNLLLQLLITHNIPYINGYYGDDRFDKFYIINKSRYFLNALRQVKTKYVLALDSRDVKIRSFEGIIEKFKTYNTRILFGAEKGNYGILFNFIEHSTERHGSTMQYLNSGCMIGYTEDCIKFYQEVVNDLDEKFNNNIMNVNKKTEFLESSFTGPHILEPVYHIITPSIFGYNDTGDLGHVRHFLNKHTSDFINVDYKSLIFLNCCFLNFYIN